MDKIKYIFIEKDNKLNQYEEKVEYLTEENKKHLSNLDILTNENHGLTNQISSISRELYLANEKIKELSEERSKFNSNLQSISKNNGNNFDSDNLDLKSTNSGNTNAIKFPNNKITGYANIKNIDESELNESDYNNSNKKLSGFNNINFGITDYKRETDLYIESGGYKNNIPKNEDLFKLNNKFNEYDKEKNNSKYTLLKEMFKKENISTALFYQGEKL